MIRDKLCEAIRAFKLNGGHTYKELTSMTNLNKTQLVNIIRNNGAEVKLETIEAAIYECGMDISTEVVL